MVGKTLDSYENLPKVVRKITAASAFFVAGITASGVEASTTNELTDDGKMSKVLNIDGLGKPLLFLGVGALAASTRKERETFILRANDLCKE